MFELTCNTVCRSYNDTWHEGYRKTVRVESVMPTDIADIFPVPISSVVIDNGRYTISGVGTGLSGRVVVITVVGLDGWKRTDLYTDILAPGVDPSDTKFLEDYGSGKRCYRS